MFIVVIRTLILYSLALIALRIMGKRQIAELQPYELVIALMLSEIAAIPMQETSIPLINGIIPIIVLVIFQLTLSFISLKSFKARRIISGAPNILIMRGKILESELAKIRYNLNDLIEMIRISEYPNIKDIEFAILETNGNLSIIPKEKANQKEEKKSTNQSILPLALILDGEIDYPNVERSEKDIAWLTRELRKNGIDNPKDVFLAFLNSDNTVTFQLKEKRGKRF